MNSLQCLSIRPSPPNEIYGAVCYSLCSYIWPICPITFFHVIPVYRHILHSQSFKWLRIEKGNPYTFSFNTFTRIHAKHNGSTWSTTIKRFFLSPSTQFYTNLCATLIANDFSVDLAAPWPHTHVGHTQPHTDTHGIAHTIIPMKDRGRRREKIWHEVSTIIN